MNQSAPTSSLMQSIRTGFKQTGSLTSSAAPSAPVSTATPHFQPSVDEQLEVLDSVLTEIEQQNQTAPLVKVQIQDPTAVVLPQVIDQATDTLNPQSPRASAKESLQAVAPVEVGAGIQYVETEKNPEIPVEVESFLQKAEDHQETLPDEIVIADATNTPMANHYVKQPVIVLPITPETEGQGSHKSPLHSIRWLVEWSRKVMKMFEGKVIYRQVESES